MSDNSAIEWTDATWNPTTGCTKVSTGCDRCYAERIALRFGRSFDLALHPDRLEQPLRWRRPRRVFVNSVSDLFHRDVPWGFIDQVFSVMEAAEHHTFQLLTKRSSAMRDYLRSRYAGRECPPHIWCGVSVEDRKALARVKHLQESPAAVRFLSCEPLIGGLDLSPGQLTGIAWVIVGGESGPGARPMSPDWTRGFRLLLRYGLSGHSHTIPQKQTEPLNSIHSRSATEPLVRRWWRFPGSSHLRTDIVAHGQTRSDAVSYPVSDHNVVAGGLL